MDTETVVQNVLYDNPHDEEGLDNSEPLPKFSVGLGECKIIRDDFGVYKACPGMEEEQIVHRFTLLNKEVTVQVLTFGATVTAVTMPDKYGVIDDVVLGFDSFEEYRNPRNPFFGSTIGRVTGIIPRCEFTIERETHCVSNNFLKIHHANGGFIGFDKVMWNAYVADDKLYLTYMSEDSEEGFPGDLLVTRCYELTERNELIIETTAKCTKPTPVDISTHIDFNLAGNHGGPEELYNHFLMLNADKYAQTDKDYIMTGKLKKVSRTILDFRIARRIGRVIHKVPGGGLDHYMSLTRGTRKCVTFAAKLMHPDSGRYVEVLCDQPGLLVYTQNNLFAPKAFVEGHPISCWVNDPSCLISTEIMEEEVEAEADIKGECELDGEEEHEITEGGDAQFQKLDCSPLRGKQSAEYVRHGGIRLVPINYPQPVAVRRNSKKYILNPGETYLNTTIYKFGTKFLKPINLAEIMVPDISEEADELGLEEEIIVNP